MLPRSLLLPAISLTFAAQLTACASSKGAGNPGTPGLDGSAEDASVGDDGIIHIGNPDGSITGFDVTISESSTTGDSTTCVNLQCQQHACSGTSTTTISGKVYDPAGNNPLYNIVVYIPNQALSPLPSGASCDACDALYSGQPIAVGLTDATGSFTIPNAPDGDNIPLVVQVGKWRKQYAISHVNACTDNPQADKSLRLPKSHTDGDPTSTNIPNIAISTGALDTLECLLSRIGLEGTEYVGGATGSGRIHIFAGGDSSGPFGSGSPNTSPAGPDSTKALWTSKASLMPYDVVLLSCEGDETFGMNQQALHDYASAGGRVFASHFHYAWFNTGPYGSENLATWSTGTNSMNNISAIVDTTFPKGAALKQWLGVVGALSGGELPIQDAKHNADVSPSNKSSQSWIISDSSA
ncbi:MAG: carboxypeptidase regulatory-like domain-containing protein, partial [Polyangiales bacterium]